MSATDQPGPQPTTALAAHAPRRRSAAKPKGNGKGKAMGGGLTRKQRTSKLRKRPGYGVTQLVPGGIPITCRESDGFVNLAEIFAAEAEQRGGKPKRLNNWMRLPTTAAYLQAVAEAEGLSALQSADGLIDRGDGREPWAHHTVACEIAGWLSPPLRVLINQLWMATINRKAHRPRPLDAAGAQMVQARRDWNRELSAELHQRAVTYLETTYVPEIDKKTGKPKEPPTAVDLVQRARRIFTAAITGSAPSVWVKLLGKDWLERSSVAFQKTMAAAAEQALLLFPRADELAQGPGFWRHYNAALKEGAAKAVAAAEMFGLPRQPEEAGVVISPGRVRRLLVAS